MSAVCALLAIVLPAIVALPTKHQIAQVGTKDESTPRHYHVVYAGLFALAFMVVGSSIMAFFPTATITTINMSTDSESENEPTSTTGFQVPEWLKGSLLLALWIGPILGLFLLPTSSTIRNDNHQNQKAIHSSVRRKYRQAMEEAADHQQILPNEAMRLIPPPAITSVNDNDNLTEKQPMQVTQPPPIDKTLEAEDMDVCETPQPIADKNLFEMLTTLEAWLFLMTACILVGAGTMLTINMGQLVQSQEFGNHPPQQQSKIESSDTDTDDDETVSSSSASNNSTATTAACLAMFSVAQAMARVASGAVSEAALTWNTRIFGIRGIPRTAFLVLSCAFAVTGHTVLALASSHLLLFVFGIVLVGFSFGGLWPLMVLIIGDLFGTVNHGANYMFADGFTCAVGTVSVAKFLTQFVYERHIVGDELACYGNDCFRWTHIIIAGLCLVSFFASIILLYMTRSSYGKL